MRDCPDPETLERLIDRALGAEQASAVETHVSGCSACETHLGELRGQRELLADMVGVLPDAQGLLASLGPEKPPDHIGALEVLGEIGRGGMGTVLRVRDPALKREMALKLVNAEPRNAFAQTAASVQVSRKAQGRFLEEAQVTSQLAHPGIVPVHALGEAEDGRPYFTMQLVQGRDLRQIFELVEEGSEGWTRTRALGVVLRVCEAMAYAHSKGVIHRDLKPSNVMVGEFGEVYVMDWGVARVLGRKDVHDRRLRAAIESDRLRAREEPEAHADDAGLRTMDGDVVGTPVYMAPEQAEGRLEAVGERPDAYSVGALLYHLLAGTVPYVARGERPSGREVLRRAPAGAPPPPSSFGGRAGPAGPAAVLEEGGGGPPGCSSWRRTCARTSSTASSARTRPAPGRSRRSGCAATASSPHRSRCCCSRSSAAWRRPRRSSPSPRARSSSPPTST